MNSQFLPKCAGGGCQEEVLIYGSMSMPLSRMLILAFVLVLGADATASARPKKHSAERILTTTCDGTPIIMQAMACRRRPARVGEREQATKRAQRPRLTARGSSGPYIAPLQSTPSLALPQRSAAPYTPPPINNASEQIKQLNESFPLNRGLGNNPTNRDGFIRYNLTR
jgi:hypothetical protein